MATQMGGITQQTKPGDPFGMTSDHKSADRALAHCCRTDGDLSPSGQAAPVGPGGFMDNSGYPRPCRC